MTKFSLQYYLAASILLYCSQSIAETADISNQLSISYGDGQRLQLSTRSQIKNWYVTSYNTPVFVNTGAQQPSQSWFFNGGYQHQLHQELSLFVEAGVNNQYDDIATRKGYNLSTGVNYQPLRGLSLQSKLIQTHQPESDSTEQSLELSSTLHLINNIDVRAIYQIEAQDKQTQQQLQLGLGYRF